MSFSTYSGYYDTLVDPIGATFNNMQDITVKGHRPPTGPVKKPRTYESSQDRVCIAPDCSTPLSRYNKGPHCNAHKKVAYPRVRGRVS